MSMFLHGHATHPEWRMALSLALAPIEGRLGEPGRVSHATLGWVYLTDHHAAQAEAVLAELQRRFPGTHWVGAVGVGVMGSGVEYFDEPAVALLLTDLPAGSWRLFSGLAPLPAGQSWHTALVHADARTPELEDLVAELASRTASGYVFGGLPAARTRACHIADGVFEGGLSGVAFDASVDLVSRVTQGCQPVGPRRTITQAEGHLVVSLDHQPTLDCLLADLGVQAAEPRAALPLLQQTLVGLDAPDGTPGPWRTGAFGEETRVRHLMGLDPRGRGIAVADEPTVGTRLTFCRRDAQAARRDLVRVCAEIREELEPVQIPDDTPVAWRDRVPAEGEGARAPARIAGAVYVSCAGRGGPHFGGPSAELQIVRHALGDVPLVGFFASGEIGHRHVYGYTGVLTVFTHDPGGA